MNFKEAINWLYGFQKFGIRLGLDRIGHIAKELGNPQEKYKTIHVGGTNGKGSVCRFLEGILVESRHSVGVCTSPHLQSITERIVVNKKEITGDEMVLLVEKIKPIVDKMIENDNTPTFFEVFTAIAFLYFEEKKVDFAIIEVGLGGRFDATNIITPVVSIITNVSLEHVDILGHTIEEITREKAGIIKPGVSVVTAAKKNALNVVKKHAKEKNASVNVVDNNWKRLGKQNFLINGSLKDYNVETSMMGEFQGENIAIAISVIENLQINGTYITDDAIDDGIKKTTNIGRMEIVSHNPCLLLDGAHNPVGIKKLAETIKKDFDYERLILVLGILSDKNIQEMLKTTIILADIIIVTKSHNERACEPSVLKDMIGKLDRKKKVVVKAEIKDAVEYTKSIANKDDLICIAGSLFTVGEARDHLIK